MEELRNGIVNNFNMSSDMLEWKVMQDYPLRIKFEPMLYHTQKRELVLPLSYLPLKIHVFEIGAGDDIKNYEIKVNITICNENISNEVYKLFPFPGENTFHKALMRPFIDGMVDIIGWDALDQLVNNIGDLTYDITCMDSVINYTKHLDEIIGGIFCILNDKYEDVKKLMMEAYRKIGYAAHYKYMLNNFCEPDKILGDDIPELLAVYRSRYATTYFLPPFCNL